MNIEQNNDPKDQKHLENLSNESIDGSDVKGGGSFQPFGGLDPAMSETVNLGGNPGSIGPDTTVFSAGSVVASSDLAESLPPVDSPLSGSFDPNRLGNNSDTI